MAKKYSHEYLIMSNLFPEWHIIVSACSRERQKQQRRETNIHTDTQIIKRLAVIESNVRSRIQ